MEGGDQALEAAAVALASHAGFTTPACFSCGQVLEKSWLHQELGAHVEDNASDQCHVGNPLKLPSTFTVF